MYQKISIVLLCSVLLTQISCGKRKREDQYKEGEIVTWSYGNDFIIKATVGERRKHLVNTSCPKCERDFYRPRFEHYLGQFPIDYQPEKFPIMTLEEAETTPRGQRRAGYPALEFNLMLNGSWVEATDKAGFVTNGLDHEDQVKVVIDFVKYKNTTIKKIFYSNAHKLDMQSATIKNGVTCYSYKSESWKQCLGKSTNPQSSEFSLLVFPNVPISAKSFEKIYGHIVIKWNVHSKHLARAQEIDTAIWRLLDAWNVSPTNHNQ